MAPVTVHEAALNNAEWCDAFCRAHGIAGRFDAEAWTSAARTPLFYPDAVTLAPGCSAANLVSRIDASAGCSIKDSFADLDLCDTGFEVLFAAEWLCLPDRTPRRRPAGWSAVTGGDDLERWEDAWGESSLPRRCFRTELLADPRVRILALSDGRQIRAGAVANLSERVIGLSNVFDLDGALDSAWGDAASAARTVWGRLPVVGYDTGDSLAAAHRAGFETIGPLAVWIRTGE